MNTIFLEHALGWGNEIHIKTSNATYAGSGNGFSKDACRILKMKPSVEELKEKGVRAIGCYSTPYIKNGDILVYETDDGHEFRMRFKNVKYENDPSDMFFADLTYIKPKILKPSFIKRLFSFLRRN